MPLDEIAFFPFFAIRMIFTINLVFFPFFSVIFFFFFFVSLSVMEGCVTWIIPDKLRDLRGTKGSGNEEGF